MRYVVIGSSAAGINAIRELRKFDKEGEIVLKYAQRMAAMEKGLQEELRNEKQLMR